MKGFVPRLWRAFALFVCVSMAATSVFAAPPEVAAAWRGGVHLDLFKTDSQGQVISAWWEAGCGWQPWFGIDPGVKMQAGAPVAAVWRSNDTHLDLFVTGADGTVWSNWWEAAPGWQHWFQVSPQVKMQPGATVTALWRSNDTHLDLFATGTDGAVWSTWWEASPGWQHWFLINPQVKMQPGATVTALWRSNDTHLDLFATGTDGAVWSTWWEATPGWQHWFLISPQVKMQPGATVTALWRSNDTHLGLFSTGTDGTVWSTWWEATPNWQPWFSLQVETQACTNLPINYAGGQRLFPDGGDADRYCRDSNTIQDGRPGYNWTEVCGSYFTSPNCYLPVSCYQLCQTYGPNIHAGFAFWHPADNYGFLYLMAEKDYLRQFRFDMFTQKVEENPVNFSSYRVPEGMPGGALSLSANGRQNGIAWLSMPYGDDATGGVHRGTLLAADALDLHQLWRDDCVLYFAKFNPPIIADSKVVLATFADPTGKAVPGQACDSPPPQYDWNTDYGAGNALAVGTAWIIVYGLKP